ncbi:hypothetical protein ACIQZO_21140 [Streptomyces sp. NPDC097617]|uniref:hypothetical protein n=1 Tax=Streptomyces sp. NPDC097617 TaxID=3366091 RepID=UPI00380EF57C
MVYASRLYRAPVPTRGWPVVGVQADPLLRQPAKAGGILPIDGDRRHVSLMGAPGGEPTRAAEHFEPFARTLRHPILADLLQHAEPLGDVSVSRLSRTATGSFRAATALTDVLALQAPPTSLVRPGVLLAALLGPLRPQLESPQFNAAERTLAPERPVPPEDLTGLNAGRGRPFGRPRAAGVS